jgi:GAF domain-containing protein
MMNWIRQFFAPPVFEGDEDKTRTASLLNIILLSILAVASPIIVISPLALPQPLLGVIVSVPMTLLCLGALVIMRRGYVRLASLIPVSIQWIAYAAMVLISGGMTSILGVGLVTDVVMAGLLLGRRAALTVAGLSIVVGLGIFLMGNAGLLPAPYFIPDALTAWLVLAANLFETAVILYLAAGSLDEALGRARSLAAELAGQRGRLEVTVEERTRDLARHTQYLEAATAIARDAVSVLDVQTLLLRVVTLVSERFGFYHTGIFLLDPTGEWAVLQTASSEGGQRMVARGHRLKVGQTGIVGETAARGKSHVALDAGADAVFFDNPDLPHTRSEVALPLRARGEIIGVLDVQSTEPAAFSQEDVDVLQTLADQVAAAINNARLFRQAEDSLEAERRAYGELGRQAWTEMVRARPDLGYRYHARRVEPIGREVDDPSSLPEGADLPAFSLPVEYRGRAFGAVVAHKPAGSGEWTPEEKALLGTLAEQLSIALDSARLYQDTQRRAAQEQLMAQVTARMRETLDVDIVLKTAAEEMRRAMGLSAVTVKLSKEEAK